MECTTIAAIHLEDRTRDAPAVQEILTEFGSIIRMRLGCHPADHPSDEGLILLQLCPSGETADELIEKLNSMERVKAKALKMP